MIIWFIIKLHCQRLLQMKNLHGVYSVHAARPQRAHGVLEDPQSVATALHSGLSNTLCKRQACSK